MRGEAKRRTVLDDASFETTTVTIEVVYRVRCGKHTIVTDIMGVDMNRRPPDLLRDPRSGIEAYLYDGRTLAHAALGEPRDHQERDRMADRLTRAIMDVAHRNEVDP